VSEETLHYHCAVSAPASPALACVVLSLGDEPGLVEAVRSIAGQAEEPVELVAVNTGGGDAAATLARAGIAIPVVEHAERRYAGGARNLGIAATRAPWVAFLAADCLAAPGWVAGRLRRHRAGAAAVASALEHAAPRNPVSWAAHVALYARRMPGAPAGERLLYGVSYARELLARYGGFAEDLAAGEDTAFNRRLAEGGVPIEWAPEVRTRHRNPRRLGELIGDHYRRGARSAAAWAMVAGGPSPRQVARNALARLPASLRIAWRAAAPGERRWIATAVPLLPLVAVAYAAGALRGPREGGR
jgi:glycosyltransferase involved in cell wall biosynthesis